MRITRLELIRLGRERFGADPKTWPFVCPNCGDAATIADFEAAGADVNKVGQECIGRSLGALTGPRTGDSGRASASRGCDWVAYGFIPGPWTVTWTDDDGTERESRSFALAEPTPVGAGQ